MNKLPNKTAHGEKIIAIIYCTEKQVNGLQFLKYSHVDNSEMGLKTFINFAKKFPGAKHVNFYNRKTTMFIEQYKF